MTKLPTQYRVVIIMPAYNEGSIIEQVIGEVQKITHADIVVINDGSRDDTLEKARNCGVAVVSLPINLGIGGAVQTGFQYAFYHRYDIAVQLDSDGQHDPRYVDTLLQPILLGTADVVIGSRFLEHKGFQSTFWRRCGIHLFQLVYWLLIGKTVTDSTSGFRAYNKKAIALLQRQYPTDFPEPESLIFLTKQQLRFQEVAVAMRPRLGSVSSISGLKPVYYMIKVLLAILIQFFRKKS